MKVAVVGGANIDITAKPYAKYIPYDSNPGKITLTLGGVGRNIAHNLALLGIDVSFLTAIGGDVYGKKIIESCDEIGINIERSNFVIDSSSSTYLCVMDENGDLMSGFSDMDICHEISPEFIEKNIDFLNSMDAVAFDTNIDEVTIEYLLANCTAPMFVDAVSVTKVEKLKNALDKGCYSLFTVKVNVYEAEMLAGIKIGCMEDIEKAAEILHSKGIKRVYITLGPDGVFASDGETKVNIPSPVKNIVNATGAGDSFLAALVFAASLGFDVEDSAVIGQSASEITLDSLSAVSESMTKDNLISKYEKNK